jgi:hypothetical protein
VELLELVVVAGTVVEVETVAEVVEEGTTDEVVTAPQAAPPVKVPQLPERSLALLKSSV